MVACFFIQNHQQLQLPGRGRKILVMLMDEQKQDSFFERWFPSRDASNSTPAMLFLAVALGAALLGAYILVHIRSGPFLANQKTFRKAEANGAELIKKVSREGISTFLGSEPIYRYYILEENEEPRGFAASEIAYIQEQEDAKIIKGKELFYNIREKRRTEIVYEVADDGGGYEMVKRDEKINMTETFYQKFEDGELKAYFTLNGRKMREITRKIGIKNFIPLPLLDFYSSLVEGEDYQDGASFVQIFGQGGTIFLIECWVKSGGEIPESVQAKTPDGHSVKVVWIQDPRRQSIYYDQAHQLVWQKDLIGINELIRKSATRSEVVEKFPQADKILNLWQSEQETSDDREVL